MFSLRTNWDLAPNALAAAIAARRGAGQELIDLTESNPTRVGIEYPAREIRNALCDERSLRYEPCPFGLWDARCAVAEMYVQQGIRVDPDQIVLTASSSEAYGFALKLLCDPGDEILVPRPSYPLLDDLAKLEDVSLRSYALLYDGRWHIDTESLCRSVTDRTRAIVVVSPNNPTGSCMTRAEHEAMQQVAAAHDLAVVSDEVFADYVWQRDRDRVCCVASKASALSISFGGLSKSACLPQMKLGWMVLGGPCALLADAMAKIEMIADTYLSVGTAAQHALRALLGLRHRMQEQLSDRIAGNIETLDRVFGENSMVTPLEIEAGWYGIVRVPATMADEVWCVLLATHDGVVVHPGSFFGFGAGGFLVLSLIAPAHLFEEGVRRLQARVATVCG